MNLRKAILGDELDRQNELFRKVLKTEADATEALAQFMFMTLDYLNNDEVEVNVVAPSTVERERNELDYRRGMSYFIGDNKHYALLLQNNWEMNEPYFLVLIKDPSGIKEYEYPTDYRSIVDVFKILENLFMRVDERFMLK